MMFDTTLLDNAITDRLTRQEGKRQETLAKLLLLLDDLGLKYNLSEVYIFGSVTKEGRFRDNSDIDIAVAGINPAHFFDLMAALSLGLGREVDLVQLRHCHFAHRIRELGIKWIPKQ